MRLMRSDVLSLEQPLAKRMELIRTPFAWQEHAVTAETPRQPKGEDEWTVCPRFDPAHD